MANNAKQNPIDQFNDLKKQLVSDLADVEVEMDNLELVYNEKIASLKERQAELRKALFDEVPLTQKGTGHTVFESAKAIAAAKKTATKKVAAKRPAKKKAEINGTTTAVQELVKVLDEYPGSSKQELRKFLPSFTERALQLALSYASKNKIVENRGSKTRPKWYVVR